MKTRRNLLMKWNFWWAKQNLKKNLKSKKPEKYKWKFKTLPSNHAGRKKYKLKTILIKFFSKEILFLQTKTSINFHVFMQKQRIFVDTILKAVQNKN